MNFLIDNNLPPAMARALHELCKADGHQVLPLREKFDQGASDIHWISELKAEGRWTVVSQDKFTKGDAERKVFRECGLPIFCLAKQWGQESYWSKAQNLVKWWPAIVQQSELISGGAAFRVSWRFTAPGKFEQLKI
ncbi:MULTISPECIES: hypothetical protein [unclassified Pseudomonas]|uniref:PIN-like domain-containing protein n=1 Tax=unclassified Pseudomonas TaxID=196821 RepID=UPI00128C3D5F|nr:MULTISPECIES: hypothetical protein [unclassified Pseudomonas]MPQ66811.1 hypothetical protein [Pseudomonas sp. MWU12-2323]